MRIRARMKFIEMDSGRFVYPEQAINTASNEEEMRNLVLHGKKEIGKRFKAITVLGTRLEIFTKVSRIKKKCQKNHWMGKFIIV